MAFQSVGDIINETVVYLWHGQICQNVFHYRVTSVVASTTTTAFATALKLANNAANQLYDKIRSCIPTQCVLDHVDIQTVYPTRWVRDRFTIAGAGTSGITSNTANLAGVVSRFGALANRHNIGAVHVPYGNNDVGMSNGAVGAAFLSSLNNLAAQMLLPIAVGGLGNVQPVLWAPKTPTISYDLVRASGQTTVRVMRRRTVGVGK